MTMAQTQLQQSRQDDQAQTNLTAAQQYDVNPNQGSVVPNVMQTQSILEAMMAEKNKMPNVNPPSEDEIQETMWISSGLIGLLGAIVSGNPAGGIAAGMTAALAIHDRGYDLRQRAGYVMDLHNKGYSARAIHDWYETGDNKELDKETDNMQRMASEEVRDAQADRRYAQQDKQFNERMENSDRQFNLQERRFDQMASHQNAMEALAEKRAENSGALSLAHLNPFMSSLSRPFNKQLRTLGDKQMYLDQLKTDIELQRSGNPAGYNALLTAVAGVDNPNISPKEGAIERVASIGGLGEQAKNYFSNKSGGVMTPEALNQIEGFLKAHQTDTNMERQAIHNKVYSEANGIIKNPELAAGLANVVAAGGAMDATAPAIASEEQQQAQANSQQQAPKSNEPPKEGEHTSAGGVTFTVKKAG